MYESYSWPGASIKAEIKLIRGWIEGLIGGVIKDIKKKRNA